MAEKKEKKCGDCKYYMQGNPYGSCLLSRSCVYPDKEHDCQLFNKDLSCYHICFNCEHYLGGGDWGLFCKHEDKYHHLGHFNDIPCEHYIRKEKIMSKDKNNNTLLEPNDMPSFLNDVAIQYFSDNQEIMDKLIDCSIYISMMNYLNPKYERIF